MADDQSSDSMDQNYNTDQGTANLREAVDAAADSFKAIETQEDLDRIIRNRLERQRAQYDSRYAGFDDIKAKADKFDELDAASKTELERAQARISELEQASATAAQAAKDSALKAAVVAEGAKRNMVDPLDALALLDRGQLEYADDGSPMNIAEAMDSLLERKPHLVAQPSGGARAGGADQGARGQGGVSQLTREALKTMSPDEIVKANQEGRLDAIKQGA